MKSWFQIIVVCFALGLTPLVQAKVIDRIVAVVNNDVITLYDLDRAMTGKSADRRQVLEDLINQRLIQQEIARADIEVTDEEMASAIDNVLQRNQINIEILRAELAAKGISFEGYREQLKEQVRQAKFIQQNLASQVQVTDRDVQNYRSNDAGTIDQGATARLAWVYFPLDPDASNNDVRHLVRKGRKIADRARRGEDFAKLGKDYWEGSKLLSDLPGPIAKTLRKMEINAVSDPIVIPQGVYIVKLYEKSGAVEEKETKTQDSAQLKQSIYQDQMAQAMNNYVLKLRRKAFIDIRE